MTPASDAGEPRDRHVMGGPRRIAYLTFGSGVYDARTLRMAETARDAGYDVTIYARWSAGLPVSEERDGIRIVRAPDSWRFAVPWLRAGARRRASRAMQADAAGVAVTPPPPTPVATSLGRGWVRHWWWMLRRFPLIGLGWAVALEEVVEPADVWHAMWAGSLPTAVRLAGRFGGRTIYDSRDVYMQARAVATAGQPGRGLLEWLERRWTHRVDRVITVNDGYARLLAEQLRIDPPAVVMNLPLRWQREDRPDRIRQALGLSPTTRIVLYQGGFLTGRGIEQAMDAILAVPDAVLGLLGFGVLRDGLLARSRSAPYAGRVFVLDPVPPDQLLEWTASADVSVMAIQPTSVNHRETTPQKLFESLAVGVPVVASDLPGMAAIVRETDAGVLCDPTEPAAIAAAIRVLLDEPPGLHEARRARIRQAARDRYNWEAEAPKLLSLYAELLAPAADR